MCNAGVAWCNPQILNNHPQSIVPPPSILNYKILISPSSYLNSNLQLFFLHPQLKVLDIRHGKRRGHAELSAESLEYCGYFFIVKHYAPLLSAENLFFVEMVDETFDNWHIYSLKMMISTIILVIVRNLEVFILRKFWLLT